MPKLPSYRMDGPTERYTTVKATAYNECEIWLDNFRFMRLKETAATSPYAKQICRDITDAYNIGFTDGYLMERDKAKEGT